MQRILIIGDLEFPSKKLAKEFFRTIRDNYPNGVRISEEDSCHLLNLAAIHPEADTKIGCGVNHFTVEADPIFGTTRHFQIHRVDGSETDISFISAIDGRNERRDRLEALRRAIKQQVTGFRDECFGRGERILCPLTGTLVTRESYHVDHQPPQTFQQLVDEWLLENSLHLENVEITPPADNQYVTEMTNPAQIESWTGYHERHAQLRMLSPVGNLSNAKRA